MFYNLLKISNVSNVTRARCLLQKPIQFLGYLSTRKFCSQKNNNPKDPKKGDLKDLKKLDCPWDDVEKNAEKKYKKIGILGVLLAAAAIGYVVYNRKEEIKKTDGDKQVKKATRKFVRPKPKCKIPNSGSIFPKHVPYLLIGGGTASFAAFRAIKSAEPKAQVLVISNECHNPYMRPPLSKEVWFTDNDVSVNKLIFKQWNGAERSLFYEPEDFYTPVDELFTKENGGVSVAVGWDVKKIDVVERKAYLEDGTEICYEKCLIATGATPKELDVFSQAKDQRIKDKVTLFRDIFDFQELNEICKFSKSVAIIGGGFLGSELACALGRKVKSSGLQVYQIFREPGNMGKILPEYLSAWTTRKVQGEGVKVIPKTEVEDVSMNEQKELVLHLNNGDQLIVDHVVVAIGVTPNTKLAETSDLEVDPELGGFLVNTEMEARSHLYVAGDCSCFYDTKLGRRRVEHHDHAVVSGRLAGENMTGANKPYLHQSMFWSDLGPDVGYEAIGIIDSSLPTVAVFAKDKDDNTIEDNKGGSKKIPEKIPSLEDETSGHDVSKEKYDKGVIFYLKNETVVGIVLWNVFNRMSIARQVLKDQRKYDDLNEVAKLFNIHDEEKASESN